MPDMRAQLAEIASEINTQEQEPQSDLEPVTGEELETPPKDGESTTEPEDQLEKEGIEAADENTDGSSAEITDMPSLAAAIDVETSFLYDLEVGMGENLPPVKLGELKDKYQLAQRKITEMDVALTTANEQIQTGQQQQSNISDWTNDMISAAGTLSVLQNQFNETDWAALEADDKVEAMSYRQKLNDAYTNAQRALNQAQQNQQQHQGQQRQQSLVKARQAFLQAVPSWTDEAVGNSELESMRSTARAVGYTDEDIGNVIDHKALIILRKAMLYDKLMVDNKSAIQKVSKAPKVLKGRGVKINKTDNTDQLISTAKKTRKQSDQTAALRAILG